MAFDKNENPKAIGWLPSDKLLAHEEPKPWMSLEQSTQQGLVTFEGNMNEALDRWNNAVAAINIINDQNLKYPPGGISWPFPSDTVNRNSMFNTFGQIMGLPVPNFKGVAEPGLHNTTLPEEIIDAYREYLEVMGHEVSDKVIHV